MSSATDHSVHPPSLPPEPVSPAAAPHTGIDLPEVPSVVPGVPDYTEEQLAVVNKMNLGGAIFHGIQFILMLATSIAVDNFKNFKLPLKENYLTAVWVGPGGTLSTTPNGSDQVYLTSASKTVSTVAFGPMVACFFLLSCLAHVAVLLPCCNAYYHDGLQRGRNYFRWIEYAISSTLMIWLIAMLFGIYDISSLILICICNATMNLLGLLQEQVNDVRDPTKSVNWLPFALGCLCGIGPWIACFQYLGSARAAGGQFPGFVWGVLFSYVVMFNTFPIAMVLQYIRKIDYLTGEKAYIVLSFVAKCILCWLVFSGANQPHQYRDTTTA